MVRTHGLDLWSEHRDWTSGQNTGTGLVVRTQGLDTDKNGHLLDLELVVGSAMIEVVTQTPDQ